MTSIFPILILNARPGAGKSEITRYLKDTAAREREERFHLGTPKAFDDFPILWSWFEEDELLERVFKLPRLHSTSDEYFLNDDYWHLLIRRLCLEYDKWKRDVVGDWTALFEFSRGNNHGGYREAYQHLSDHILMKAAVLYVNVSFEESSRKNRSRYNPDRPDSIMEHTLTDEKMERLYRDDDWFEFAGGGSGYLTVRDNIIPYVVLENEDDVTTNAGSELGDRLEVSLATLWALWNDRPGR
ncbi:MAG: hypothetical protein GTO18_07860 [Anaerolineales bacterium]|nr:hypothetical protein [Anaerolineales bacterium]